MRPDGAWPTHGQEYPQVNTPSVREEVLQYLKTHNVMSIATHGQEGLWNTAVFYVNKELNLFFVSPPDTRHCRNIEDTAELAVTIHEDYTHWTSIKGIQMAATAERITGTDQASVIELYKNKFTFLNDPAMVIEKIMRALDKSAWYRVTPSRVFFVNNEKDFGNRTELPVD